MSNLGIRTVSGHGAGRRLFRATLAASVSVLATGVFAQSALAQDAAPQAGAAAATDEGNEIVVSGFRASLERSMDIKRDSSGVVDAVSAEDIGKFPDTNLAESLQRVPGVSIDRVNGEGSQVTVRGFGPQFNLVTVNGHPDTRGPAKPSEWAGLKNGRA